MRSAPPTSEDVGAAENAKKLDDLEQDARAHLQVVAGAESILGNEFFKDTMESIEQEFMRQWRESPPDATDERERCHIAVETLQAIRQTFEVSAHGKQTALQSIEQIIKKRKWFDGKQIKYA